jgi:ParB family chromosome partitioning protein
VANSKTRPERRDPLATFFRPQETVGVEDLADARLIDVGLIDPNPYQPRRRPNDAADRELAASVRQHGVLQPLLVRPVDGRYQIVAGERRWRASRRAGLRQVPCIERLITDDDMEVLSLLENIQRQDLDPLDEAHAYQRLMERFHVSLRDLAARVQKSHEYIAGRLRLIADPAVEAAVRSGAIGPTVGRELARLDDPERRQELLDRARAGERVTVKDVVAPLAPADDAASARPAAPEVSTKLTAAEPPAAAPAPGAVTSREARVGPGDAGRGPATVLDSAAPESAAGDVESGADDVIVLATLAIIRLREGEATLRATAPRETVLRALRQDLACLEEPPGP